MILVSDLKEWLDICGDANYIKIGDDGLTLVELDSKGDPTGEDIDVGSSSED